ncbi:MAG: cytochrome d ubiquinol oxidase subunit II [Aestuariibacter sp.]
MFANELLPDIFALLLAVAVFMYAILDGYDLGVGMLLPWRPDNHQDQMIASIGPFWDANETWLVLAVGILLIAFPKAHSIILTELYLPIVVLLIGLIVRGVSFDFRAKVAQGRKEYWDKAFKTGSLMAAGAQGFMLGAYVMGFDYSLGAIMFCMLSVLGVVAAYCLIGACWLLMKTEDDLQQNALRWSRNAWLYTVLGIVAVCLVNPLVDETIFNKWLALGTQSDPGKWLVLLVPVFTIGLLAYLYRLLHSEITLQDDHCVAPFVSTALVFLLCFLGLAYSFYPFVVPGQLTIQETASAADSLRFILVGAIVVVPCILAYTAFSYYVFRGKVTDLKYY